MKNNKEKYKKDTLYNILKEGDDEKIHDFLIRNGKKKSYCPICFRKEPIIIEDNNK